MGNPQHWCSMHGGWHEDKRYAERFGRCRPCYNKYQCWARKRREEGLAAGVVAYLEAHNLELVPRPGREPNVTCNCCLKRPKQRGTFCRGCHNAYQQWGKLRRDRGRKATMQEFYLAVDQGWVVPRHEGEHHAGKVIRSI